VYSPCSSRDFCNWSLPLALGSTLQGFMAVGFETVGSEWSISSPPSICCENCRFLSAEATAPPLLGMCDSVEGAVTVYRLRPSARHVVLLRQTVGTTRQSTRPRSYDTRCNVTPRYGAPRPCVCRCRQLASRGAKALEQRRSRWRRAFHGRVLRKKVPRLRRSSLHRGP